jgi:hypothetical protein
LNGSMTNSAATAPLSSGKGDAESLEPLRSPVSPDQPFITAAAAVPNLPTAVPVSAPTSSPAVASSPADAAAADAGAAGGDAEASQEDLLNDAALEALDSSKYANIGASDVLDEVASSADASEAAETDSQAAEQLGDDSDSSYFYPELWDGLHHVVERAERGRDFLKALVGSPLGSAGSMGVLIGVCAFVRGCAGAVQVSARAV